MATARYVALRVVLLVPVVIGITLMTFVVSHVIAGDPARLIVGEMASPEALAQVRQEYGLDLPLPVQYARYLGHLASGDLGVSYMTRRPVIDSLRDFLPATVELATAALLVAIVAGGVLGTVSAVARGSPIDHVVRVLAVSGVSLPAFWLALVALVVFYLWLGWLPGAGRIDTFVSPPERLTGLYLLDSALERDGPAFRSAVAHLVLPALVLGFGHTASIARVLRASMLDVLQQDYIRTARAKGVRARTVIVRHALRNALLPTLTIVGLQVGGLLEGAVLTETVFAWPGMGKFAVDAIKYLDYPVVLGFTVVAAVMFVTVNLVVDVLYTVLDPRIQLAA